MSTSRRNQAIYAAASLAAAAWLPTGAYAQAQQNVSGAIEEVLVTARRREESLQDVPIAISAFGGENLQQRGVESIQNMNAIAPNLSVMGGGNSGESQATFRVRGMPGVSVYIDGVNQATTDGLLTMGVVEVDRIEVLRGPQGTLFGNASLGGAISYVTRAPADTFGARVQGSIGSFNRRDFQAAVDMPLSDTFKTKFTVASMSRDGFVHSQVIDRSYGDVNDELARADFLWTPTDSLSFRYNAEKATTNRVGPARVVWEIGETRAVAVPGGGVINTNPQVQAYINAFDVFYNNANNTSGQSYSTNLGKYDTRVAWETNGVVIDVMRHTLDANWDINDTFRVRSITGYKEQTRGAQVDFDGAAEVILLERDNRSRTYSFSEELQILGSHERVDWVLGAFYQVENNLNRTITWGIPEFTCDLWSAANRTARNITLADQIGCYNNRARGLNQDALQISAGSSAAQLTTAATALRNGNFNANGVTNTTFGNAVGANGDTGSINRPETQAIFGDVTWRVTDQFTIAAGLRYSEDTSDGTYSLANNTLSRGTLLPDNDIPNYFGFRSPLPNPTNPSEYDAITKRLTFQYQWTPDIMTYIGYADGYTPGGRSTAPASTLNVAAPVGGVCAGGATLSAGECVSGYMRDVYIQNRANLDVFSASNPLVRDEQTVKSYEVGMRADWLGGALRTNITAFLTDWAEVPVSTYVATRFWDTNGDGFAEPFGTIDVDGQPGLDIFFFPSLYTAGVKKAEAKGIEFESTWRATDNLTLNLNVGWLDTSYTELGQAGTGVVPAVSTGSRFAGAPEYTANFSASYEFAMDGGSAITPRLDYTWTDEYTLQTGDVLQRNQEAYGLLNARIGYDSGSNWNVALTGSNLTDEYYFNSGFYTRAEQIHFMTVGRPREWGLTFNFRFE